MSAELMLREHQLVPKSAAATVLVDPHQTLEAMLLQASDGLELSPALWVSINDIEVPRERWARVRPKPGTRIDVVRVTRGGNGGKILRTVLMVAVVALATAATGGLFGGAFGLIPSAVAGSWQAAVLGASISMFGQLAVNALVKPPRAELGGSSDTTRLNMLTGISNAYAPGSLIPYVLGEFEYFPPMAAKPYTESSGSTQYQCVMLDLGRDFGWGMEVDRITIGGTPIGNYEEVQYEVTQNPTLYTFDREEVAVGAELKDGDTIARFTVAATREISVEYVFPGGLTGVNSKGKKRQPTATIITEYRLVGTDPWIEAPAGGTTTAGIVARAPDWVGNTLTRSDSAPFIAGRSWGVEPGTYEVRARRLATDWAGSAEDSRYGDATWSVLRSIRHEEPSTTGTWKLCLRIKSTGQLSGTLNSVKCRVRNYIPIWEDDAWSAPRLDYNLGWVVYHLLRSHPSLIDHPSEESMRWEDWVAFGEFCALHGFEARGVVDAEMTLQDMVDDLLANAMAVRSSHEMKYGVVFDDGNQLYRGMITPYDQSEITKTRQFVNLAHAVRVKFRNPDLGYDNDEIVVPRDGYSWRGLDARGNPSEAPPASEIEEITMRWAGVAKTAWMVARMHIAVAVYRKSTYTVRAGSEHFCFTKGDLVEIPHEITQWGYGMGKVAQVFDDHIILDNIVQLDLAKSWVARLRNADGDFSTVTVVPDSAETYRLNVADTSGIAIGDVVAVGEYTVGNRQVLITAVSDVTKESALFTCVPFDERIPAYWADPPASIISEVSGNAVRREPLAPVVESVVSSPAHDTPDDNGVTRPQVHIALRQPASHLDARAARDTMAIL